MARTNLGKIVMIPKGTYSTTVTYSKLDVVTSNGSGYISKSDNNLNKPLTNETYWMKLVEKGDKGDKGDSYIITEDDIQEIEDYVVDKTSGQIVSTRNELERVKNDILETGEDTDTFIHLEDSAMAELQEIKVDGVCEQTTTTGRNFLPSGVPKTETINNVIFSCDGNGKYTINGTASANITCYFNLTNSIIFPASEALYIHLRNTIANANIGFGLLIENNTYEPALSTIDRIVTSNKLQSGGTLLQVYIKIPANIELNFTLTPSVETSSTATDYEPYTGGQPSPSPDYPQEIEVQTGDIKLTSCNKNLFDIDNVNYLPSNTSVTKNADNSVTYRINTAGTWWDAVNYKINSIKPNTRYAFQLNVNNISITSDKMTRILIDQMTSDNKVISTPNPKFIDITTTGSYNMTLLSEKNVAYFLVRIYVEYGLSTENTSITLSNVMIEQNTSTTSYVDHLYSQITAKLPEGEFIGKINDTYKDTLNVEYNEEDGQYHLNLYKRVYKNNSYNGESYNYYISTTARNDGIINCGELQTGQVVYYLGDETILDLGVVDMPITYNEVTNLFTDSDLMPNINAKYYRNFISTVRNLQVNEKALKQELIDINTRLSALESAQTNVASESEVVE